RRNPLASPPRQELGRVRRPPRQTNRKRLGHEGRKGQLHPRAGVSSENLKTEILRNQKSEIGNRKSEIGNRKSEIGNRKSEIGNRKSEIGNLAPQRGNPNTARGNAPGNSHQKIPKG